MKIMRLKKLVVRNLENCASCHLCMTACAKAYYKTEDVRFATLCVHDEKNGITKFDICTQCGKCAEVCPVEAISLNAQGVYMINRNLCVGCLACMDICPENVIRKSNENTYVTKCIACGICTKACPANVLEVERA